MNLNRRGVFRVVVASVVLVSAQSLGVVLIARFHLMQHLLAPSAGSLVAVCVALAFLLLRILVIGLLPGLLAAAAVASARRTRRAIPRS